MVAGVTALSHAASVNWSADYSYQPGTDEYNEGWLVAYIDNSDISRSAFLALTGDDLANAVETYGGIGDLTDSEGYSTGLSKSDAYSAGSTVTGYLVLFNAATVAAATKMYVTETMDSTFPAAEGLAADASFGDLVGTQSANGWQNTTSSVPEPTSGMLLLLGMAGLALRRRRA